ncbi:serine protease FAM111A-like isoform X2 [Anarhichas minor]|uniref:serine protease FAM111A-like isoform X2 n=1 Tax=Anarhichas minor TaxID=65739 RepID=UPI003F739EAC
MKCCPAFQRTLFCSKIHRIGGVKTRRGLSRVSYYITFFSGELKLSQKNEKMEPSQDQHLKTTNNEQMDKVIKPGVKPETSGCTPPLAQSQLGPAPVPHDSLLKQEEEPHETHSFQWWWNNKSTITCNKARTVESLLKRSSQFREIANKNKNKELVIVRDGKAISSHFPCSLIKDEQLTIKYVKAVDGPKQPPSGSDRCQRKRPSCELVMFHLLTKGGKDVVRMMRNSELRNDGIDEMTVYAYRGEEVKHALKRDGRLLDIVFTKNCALSTPITEVTTEMSDLVDALDGKTFRIILLGKSSPPDSQSGSLEDADTTQNESQRCDSEGSRDPLQQSTAAESVNVNTPKQKAGLDGQKAPEIMFREIANSKEMQSYLSSQFTDLVKEKKVSSLSHIQNLYRVEYGKNAQTCREVKTLKTLMELSNSVCQVRVNDRAEGSGFLLFDKFVLTNGHVLTNIYNESTDWHTEKVTVHFSFESLGQEDSGALVEQVAGFEHGHDASGHQHDWALLEISAHQKLPEGLLTHFGFLPQSGGICIIGHPGEGVKKIDPCFIVPTENFNQVVERHRHENPEGVVPHNPDYSENNAPIQLITDRFFDDVKNDEPNRHALNYESCLTFGSSGSPVFDDHCNVVAMHSGGFPYRNARGESHSVIEYGYSLSVIIEHIIIQMAEREKFDVLKTFQACSADCQQQMPANLKKLLEREISQH